MTAPRANGAPSSSSKVTGAHAPTVPLRILLLRFSTHPCPRPANTEARTAQPPAPAAPWPGGLRNHQFTRITPDYGGPIGSQCKKCMYDGLTDGRDSVGRPDYRRGRSATQPPATAGRGPPRAPAPGRPVARPPPGGA